MTRVWVLGAGQLGTMLKHAGMPLDIDVRPVALDSTEIPSTAGDDIVTPEIEHWPITPATTTLANHSNLVNRSVFGLLADRLSQKQLLDRLKLATAPWRQVEDHTCEEDLYSTLGEQVLLKQRRGGYDGKGQYWLKQPDQSQIPAEWRNTAIAERRIPFDEEVSVIGVRDARGNTAFYPLVLNLHVNGTLTASIAPLDRLFPLQNQAEAMLSAILHDLNYVGVMAMECFRVGDQLLINELAPRVHNSGHWTQAGCSISQFESHLRAICGLPVLAPASKGLTLMVNLLGCERNDRWLEIPHAELWWYGKEVRPGRKVGHINLCIGAAADGEHSLDALEPLLPHWYTDVFNWIRANIKP